MQTQRIDRVRGKMAENGIDSLIVSDPMSIWYLTGLLIHPGERMLCVLITPDKVKLFVNALFPTADVAGLEKFVLTDAMDPTAQLSQDVTGAVGVDKNWQARFLLPLMAAHPGARFVNGSLCVDDCRLIKDEYEKEQMRLASLGNDRVMAQAIPCLREGMTEREFAEILGQLYCREGMPEVAFDSLICFGENGAYPHHSTGDTRLKKGDSVIIDTGHRLGMYCSDMTRTVFFGEVSEKQRRIYDIVNRANAAAEAAVRPGVTLGEIDAAARSLIKSEGYGEFFTHRTGHGIGIDVHEPYDVGEGSTRPALPGMVFSIEPGIYLPGEFGVRVEDLVLVTETGCEVLNKHTHDLIVVE